VGFWDKFRRSDLTTAEHLKKYYEDMIKEQDYLVCRFMVESGAKISDVVIVEKQTDRGRLFYPELKSNLGLTTEASK
jgi:intergrase/recombinase